MLVLLTETKLLKHINVSPCRINVCDKQIARKKKALSQRKWRLNKSYQVDVALESPTESQGSMAIAVKETDQLCGRDILVETKSKQGKNYGFCKAKIVGKDGNGYRCQYYAWENSFVVIPESDIRDQRSDIVLVPRN
eukprot:Seg5722.1 transcript_id=Seg5722.1/GoldUCD/mRNA.D3Y31 product="hypothetical protein" protein_id=Seg5722.1/GoldUCD/D3Y31